MIQWRHYVYIHRRADTGEPFYVGKGVDNRAWHRTGRSPGWRVRVATHGIRVEIFAYFRTAEKAFETEKRLIAEFRSRHSLANVSEGGQGGKCSYAFDDESLRKGIARHKRRKDFRVWKKKLVTASREHLSKMREQLRCARPDEADAYVDQQKRRLLKLEESRRNIDRPQISAWNRYSLKERRAIIERQTAWRKQASGCVRQ